MCLSAGAMLALSALSTGASMYMQNQAQKSSMKRYNNEVTQQNRMLSQQYADRQKKINSARDEQAKTFQQVADQQDAELANQRKIAAEKQALFQDMAQKPVVKGADSPEFQQAVDQRNQLFTDTATTPSYMPSGTDTAENRVLRSAAEKANLREKEKTSGMADALSRMGAMGDVQQAQGQLFRDLNLGLTDKANEAQSGTTMLNYKLRSPEYHMGALSNVMGEQASMPYFRGQEPQYKPPNTLFADLLGGAGQLGSMYSFYQPGAVKPTTMGAR